MKKFLILFLSATLFLSCSSDDDATTEDRILGVWNLTEINNGEALGLELNECSQQSTMEFRNDGTARTEFYSVTNGDCTAESGSVTWSNNQESKYTIQLPFQGLGPQPGRVEFNQDNTRFTFYPDILSGPNGPNTNIVFEKI